MQEPGADSRPGTKPGNSDAKPGWEWDQVCLGCWRGPTDYPSLVLGGAGSLRNTGTLPQARDTSLSPRLLGLDPSSCSPTQCLQQQTHWDRWKKALNRHLFGGMSPPHLRKEGHYRASPCLQGWKQPQLLDTQSGTRRLLGRGRDSRPGDTVLINPPQANAGCGQAPAMNGGLSQRLF